MNVCMKNVHVFIINECVKVHHTDPSACIYACYAHYTVCSTDLVLEQCKRTSIHHVGFSGDRWKAQYMADCRRLELPRGCIDLSER